MIKTLVIDDEPLALQQLAAYVRKIPFLDLVAECQSAIEARDIINNERIDAIFVDINMPDMNGMDFVRSLAAPPLVVFTTAYSEYAVDGFDYGEIRFFEKRLRDVHPCEQEPENQQDARTPLKRRIRRDLSCSIRNRRRVFFVFVFRRSFPTPTW